MDKFFGKESSTPKQERAEPSIEDIVSLYREYEQPEPSEQVRRMLAIDPSAAMATVKHLCEEIEGARVHRRGLNVARMIEYGEEPMADLL